MSTLIITEKNKAAKAIAEALGNPTIIKKSRYINVLFLPKRNTYVVPLRGHLLSYRNTEKYQKWNATDPRNILTDLNSIKKYPLSYAKPYITTLKQYARLCNKCVIGTDADVEGCNIGLVDALPFVLKENPQMIVSQLWLSSLQKKEILDKFSSLIKPKFSWAQAGEARAIIDAFIGFASTREMTRTFKSILKQFNQKFISVGRVQTSLLYLLYLREKNIEAFTPEKYFTISSVHTYNGDTYRGMHESNPFKAENLNIAEKVFDSIQNEKFGEIRVNNYRINKKTPPSPLNTSKALVLLTKTLKISANVASKTMNELYLKKIITYPRTDSDVYKKSFDHLSILHQFCSNKNYGKYTSDLIENNTITPTQGVKDVGDHPPITPLVNLNLSDSKLSTKVQKKVYDVLSRHYLSLFGNPAVEHKYYLKVLIKGESFSINWTNLIDKGFLSIIPFLSPKYDNLKEIKTSRLPIVKILFDTKKTKPPPHYTDSAILKLMERKGLGTKATRPQILSILLKRKLVHKKRYSYYISELGKLMITNLEQIWKPFLDPSFTKKVENSLEMIKENKKSSSEVISEIRKEFLDLFDLFLTSKPKLVSSLANYRVKNQFNNNEGSSGANFLPCPYCKEMKLKLIKTKKSRFFACQNTSCKKILSLPKRGIISILKTQCKKCNFNVLRIKLSKQKTTFEYYMCPFCWNIGLKDSNSTSGFCNNCKGYKIKDEKCQKVI